MNCSVDGCNSPYRIMVKYPRDAQPMPYCAEHAIKLYKDFTQQQEKLAPVIDIKTRKRIGSWSNRYANRPDQCILCGASDDGTHTIVSNGYCRDTEDCKETQQYLKDNPPPEPVKKPRKEPYVDRKGMSFCSHESCKGKKYIARYMTWVDGKKPEPYCSEHAFLAGKNGLTFTQWQSIYRKKT